jgi:hypothetical protein
VRREPLGGLDANHVGFLEVSLGNYDAALIAVGPLLSYLDAAPNATEIPAAAVTLREAVEANLSRIYRKLDIHSRAELGR